jgi:glycosyltransferase involved in cell wall biosynthesis
VVAARRGSLPEVLGGAGILIDPDDHEGMAGAMRTVLTDGATRRRMAEAGLLRARAYSWDMAARTLYDAYAAALRGRNAA